MTMFTMLRISLRDGFIIESQQVKPQKCLYCPEISSPESLTCNTGSHTRTASAKSISLDKSWTYRGRMEKKRRDTRDHFLRTALTIGAFLLIRLIEGFSCRFLL